MRTLGIKISVIVLKFLPVICTFAMLLSKVESYKYLGISR